MRLCGEHLGCGGVGQMGALGDFWGAGAEEVGKEWIAERERMGWWGQIGWVDVQRGGSGCREGRIEGIWCKGTELTLVKVILLTLLGSLLLLAGHVFLNILVLKG